MVDTLFHLFWSSCKVGLLAFGGGNAAIPLLEAEAVPLWVSQEEFAELVGINFAFPGVSIVKISGLIGLRAAGVPGLLVAITGLTTPGLLLSIAAATVLRAYRDVPYVQRALAAMQLAAVALLASSALRMLTSVPTGPGKTYLAVTLVVGLFIAVHQFRMPPAVGVGVAIAFGVIFL